MDKQSLTLKQIEAHLNEYKGNVLEFLLAQKLAAAFHLEVDFLQSLSEEYLAVLSSYEKKIRELDPTLLENLPVLATKATELLLGHYKSISKINLVGKEQGSGKNREWKEADILLGIDDLQCGLSLKLCKRGGFVNTKSGGIRSFLSKYFSYSSQIELREQEMNQLVDHGFLQMIHSLYEDAALSFHGSYDSQWLDSGFSELPGELNHTQKEIVHYYYHQLAKKLHQIFLKLYEEDREQFLSSLLALLGHSDSTVDHLYIFHQQNHQWDHGHFLDRADFKKLNEFSISIGEVEEGLSYFYIYFHSFTLQIRLKPMNKFTSASLKVNCSVKFI